MNKILATLIATLFATGAFAASHTGAPMAAASKPAAMAAPAAATPAAERGSSIWRYSATLVAGCFGPRARAAGGGVRCHGGGRLCGFGQCPKAFV